MYFLAYDGLGGLKAINRRFYLTKKDAEHEARWTHGGRVVVLDYDTDQGRRVMSARHGFA